MEETQKEPLSPTEGEEKKKGFFIPPSTSHRIIYAVMLTYFLGVIIGAYIVLFKDFQQLGAFLSYLGAVAAVGIAFYSWKAKAENVVKLTPKQVEKVKENSYWGN